MKLATLTTLGALLLLTRLAAAQPVTDPGAPPAPAAPPAAPAAPGPASPAASTPPPAAPATTTPAPAAAAPPAAAVAPASPSTELPPAEPSAPPASAQKNDLPSSLRGRFGLDTASFTDGDDALSVIALRLLASVPVSQRVALDARLPLGLGIDNSTAAVLGNLMLGAHATLPIGTSTWISVGGALGVPLLSGRTQRSQAYAAAQVPSAMWNLHEYTPSTVPIELRAALEHVWSPISLRAELVPVVMAPLGRNDQVEVAILHAGEVEIGGVVAGGLRLQGVALPTFAELENTTFAARSSYQAAFEPFLAVQKPGYYLRAGFMLPLSNPLGYSSTGLGTYGVRLAAGVHLD
ncbi:MAG: hypothetical protein IPQ09_01725 [Myxococcales bacterium]|nr:hypothetical protein [Myxococcales bacterium]